MRHSRVPDACRAHALVRAAPAPFLAMRAHVRSVYVRCLDPRTLDLAADSAEALLDWYLAIASLMPHSTEPLLDEPGLRARIEQMAP
jgi:hypothetical protein